MHSSTEKDCTSKCRSFVHCRQLLNCVSYATPSQLRSYAVWLCHNFSSNQDELGRNLLHLAASCGKWEIVEWLLNHCNVEIDMKDHESGWTALHRSFYYGQLAAARTLLMNGANLKLTDHDGLTPLDIVMKDRLPYIEYLPSYPCDVYVWGSNANYNLGNSQSRKVPEVLEFFRKASVDLVQVVLCKYHSAFLSSDGRVFTCGGGHGGRLGQGNEGIALEPNQIKGIGSCSQVSAGQDHLMMLLENGQVWSCGLNTYHQLGHYPPVERLLTPKPISLKFMKDHGKIMGVCAARFHSVIFTSEVIWTFGLNAGQLGHPKGDRTQIQPRQVSALNTDTCRLSHVETSDGAIVCATTRGDIYVLHEYQVRKIASRQLEISKLSVVGGHLDSRCDVAGVREGGGLELRVALLTKSGKLYLWYQSDPYLRRCLFNSTKELVILDMHLNHHTLGLITLDNEGYLATVAPSDGAKRQPPPVAVLHQTAGLVPSSGFTVLLDKKDCHTVRVKKLENVYRGTSITADDKGRNFAVLQADPKMGLIDLPFVSDSKMIRDFSNFYQESHSQDEVHDVVINVGNRDFAAHRFILTSRSEYFRQQLQKDSDRVSKSRLQLDHCHPEAFAQVMKYIYTSQCDFLRQDYQVTWGVGKENGKKSKAKPSAQEKELNPVRMVQELSKKLGLKSFAAKLNSVKLVNGRISVQSREDTQKLKFNRKSMPNMSDVNLISSGGTVFACHKCILISRLEYFRSMLGVCWVENSQLANLTLPISSPVMEVLLEYLYTDETAKVNESDNVEFLCNVLLISDQLLIERLKEITEVALVRQICLKNAAELLELSLVYNATQLKNSCMQFICINLAAIVESKSLEVLSDEGVHDLTTYYRNLVPRMSRRIITATCSIPAELESVEKSHPVSSSYQKASAEMREICKSTAANRKRRSVTRNSVGKEEELEKVELSLSEVKIQEKLPEPVEVPSVTPPPPPKTIQLANPSHQRVMSCPSKQQLTTLDEIMQEEKRLLTPLSKKTGVRHSDNRPIPHLSQKQRKLMVSNRLNETPPNSPPDASNCPWAKLPDQSPPSPSFWDSFAKKDFHPSPLTKSVLPESPVTPRSRQTSDASSPNIVISLNDIQRDEEIRLQRTINPKVKPLHILNIEDQAIEELIELYSARDNTRENITVARVLSEQLASPIWKRPLKS